MKTSATTGVILVVFGIIAFACHGITYTTLQLGINPSVINARMRT